MIIKKLLTITFCLLNLLVKSQNASVVKSTFGIQTGILGIWIHNESKLTNKIALLSEIGLDTGANNGTNDNTLFLAQAITLEPRYYYNLNKRQSKSKK